MQTIMIRILIALCFAGVIGIAVFDNPTKGNTQANLQQYLPFLLRRAPVTHDPPLEKYTGLLQLQDGGDYDYYSVRGDGSGLTNITNNTIDDRRGTWSPDGTYLLYTNRSGSTVTSLASGEHYRIGTLEYKKALWSPDGHYIFLYSTENVFLFNVLTRELHTVPTGIITNSGIFWSPTSRYIAWADQADSTTVESRLWVWTVGEDAPQLLATNNHIRVREWNRQGNRFGFTINFEDNPYEEVDGVYTTDFTGKDLIEVEGLTGYRWVGWEQNDTTLLVSHEDQVFRVEQDGSNLTPITSENVTLFSVKLSPQGNYLLYHTNETQYLLDLSSSIPTSLGGIYCRDVPEGYECGEGYSWISSEDFVYSYSKVWGGGYDNGMTLGSTRFNPPHYLPMTIAMGHYYTLPFSTSQIAISEQRYNYSAPTEYWSSMVNLESLQSFSIPYPQNGEAYVLEWRYIP
jgi:hypothetical protein